MRKEATGHKPSERCAAAGLETGETGLERQRRKAAAWKESLWEEEQGKGWVRVGVGVESGAC